jgi:hypothetical protein
MKGAEFGIGCQQKIIIGITIEILTRGGRGLVNAAK